MHSILSRNGSSHKVSWHAQRLNFTSSGTKLSAWRRRYKIKIRLTRVICWWLVKSWKGLNNHRHHKVRVCHDQQSVHVLEHVYRTLSSVWFGFIIRITRQYSTKLDMNLIVYLKFLTCRRLNHVKYFLNRFSWVIRLI
jgi:hypothetical protein